ncbi:MAG TPA: reverse transcriptase family protein, partial [Candidatus Caenarcaniphilales bacterium]
MRSSKQASCRRFPLIQADGQTATDTNDKINLFKQAFFPEPPPPNLRDLEGYIYPPSIEVPDINIREIEEAIRRAPPRKAPGTDGIPNHILQRAAPIIAPHLTRLLRASLALGYYPRHCKDTNTIVLRKPGKDDYTQPKAYRPIALLNTLGKIMESVIAKRISYLVETYKLLPQTHMGGRRMTSVETAVQLLVEKTHAAWKKQGSWVVSILSLDVEGAFDNVSHARLVHNLKKRRIPAIIVYWIESFLANRATYITLEKKRSDPFYRPTGIPQGSSLSPILYLFYNADLLDLCDDQEFRTSGSGYIDDIDILTFSTSTEENCESLIKIH